MAVPPPQQASRYTMATPPTHQPHSSMPPPPVPNFQSTLSYTPTNQGPQAAPQSQAQAPAAQADPLEQRVLDLLYPYRDECFTDEDNTSVTKERNALILCENIAFLIRHNQSSYGRHIEPNDVSVASRGWQAMKHGSGVAGIGVFVNGNGFSHTVVRTTVGPGEGAVEQLSAQADLYLQTFFPDN